MQILIAARLRRLLGMVLIGMIPLAFAPAASAQAPQTVFSSKWNEKGAGPGLINVPEHEIVGPLTFCVDGGNVYLADTVNQRILRAAAGSPAEVLAGNVLASAICPDGQGGVWVRVGNAIQRLDAGGKATAEKAITSVRRGRIATEGYGIELVASPAGAVEFRQLDQSAETIDAGRQSREATAAPDLRYFIKRFSGNDVRILGEAPDGKILVTVPVQIESGYPGAVLFKGTDSDGNLYIELERIDAGTIGLEVHAYAPDGTPLRKIPLFNSYFSTVYKKTEVAPDGTVYQMITTPEGVEVVCYKGGEES
jgi:hypothetical protein